MSLVQSQTHLEELPWEPKSLLLFCLNGKWKVCVRHLKSSLSLPIPLPHLLSAEILRPGKRTCPQPPLHTSWQPETWELHGDMRGLVQLAPHCLGSEIWPLMQSERDLPPHPTPLPPRLWSQPYKELQVFSCLRYLLWKSGLWELYDYLRFPRHSFKNAIVGFTVGEKSLIMQLYADLKIDSKRFKRLPNTPGNARFQLHWCIPFTSSFSCKHRETGEKRNT